MDRKKIVRIGTRSSKLALIQTEQVIAALSRKFPELQIEKVILTTRGDKILNKPLIDFGGKGAFITEFEEALLKKEIDLAVHSAKDMPVKLAQGLEIAGVLPRADVRDVLVTKKEIGDLKENFIIGTGSLRRQFQLKRIYPNVQCISIRGNVTTRLQKIRDGECDGVVLAAAGLERLGLLEQPEFEYRYFSSKEMVPAGGQGIIAIEGRKDDELTKMIQSISDAKAEMELETERKVLQLLDAGCHEAIGVVSGVLENEIEMWMIQEQNGVVRKQRGKADIQKRMELAEQLVSQLSEEK